MENNLYNKLFKRCWYVSLVCYIVSFLLPVYDTVDKITFGQGLVMFCWGWIPVGFQFLVWLANPIFFILRIRVRMKTDSNGQFTSTAAMRYFAYAVVVLGLLFFFKAELIEDEGGCLHEIKAFHVGYWMWEISMILLALALMAKSEANTKARRVVDVYLCLTNQIPFFIKILIIVVFAFISDLNAIYSSNRQKVMGPLSTMSFSGYYETCEKVDVKFLADNKVIATISSTDFVGHFSKQIRGSYRYNAPYVFIHWDERVDMKYMQYDSIGHRMVMYGQEDTYYLYQYNRPREEVTNHSFTYNERVVIPDNDYYVVDTDSIINGYGTNAQELRLPEGYHLTYADIYDHLMSKFRLDEDGKLPILYHCEDRVLKYEDDTLMIVFDRINIVTTHSNKPLRLEDYSAVPMMVFDKRKSR